MATTFKKEQRKVLVFYFYLFCIGCCCCCCYYYFFFAAGYPRLLSGHYTTMQTVHRDQRFYFPETTLDQPWTKKDSYKRYRLTFPCYPFRTLSPRELFSRQTKAVTNDFRMGASCLMPAHTQLHVIFHRRPLTTNFLDHLLPENLNAIQGSLSGSLTADIRRAACRFQIPGPPAAATADAATPNAAAPAQVSCTLRSVAINLRSVYLQVSSRSSSSSSSDHPSPLTDPRETTAVTTAGKGGGGGDGF